MNNHFLLPETIYISKKPSRVITILGSCVSVCLHDKKLNFGGLIHFLLPDGHDVKDKYKYGNLAIKELINKMLLYGSSKINIEAKIFGGASQMNNDFFGIGRKNISIAKEILFEEGIVVTEAETGGNHGRKLTFFTNSGKAFINTLENQVI